MSTGHLYTTTHGMHGSLALLLVVVCILDQLQHVLGPDTTSVTMTSIQLIVVQQQVHHMHNSGGNYWLLELYALLSAFDHATYITVVGIVSVQECAWLIVYLHATTGNWSSLIV